MIKKLKRKFAYWLLEENYDPIEIGRDGRVMESNSIRIDIYRGEGGVAIETSVYNRKRDENYIGFHIVHDDQSLGQALSKIITAESIKAL
jgi:hypothetical protein